MDQTQQDENEQTQKQKRIIELEVKCHEEIKSYE